MLAAAWHGSQQAKENLNRGAAYPCSALMTDTSPSASWAIARLCSCLVAPSSCAGSGPEGAARLGVIRYRVRLGSLGRPVHGGARLAKP
jgi:hypothetical protein